MKRILITTGIFPPDIGGPASYARTFGSRLARQFGVTLMTYSSVFSHEGDKTLPFKVMRTWKKVPRFLRHGIYFLKTLREVPKHDLVFSLNSVNAGVPALLAAQFYKKKFVVKVVGDYAWEIAINKKKTNLLINDFQKEQRRGWISILHRLQTWVCKNANAIVVPSEYLATIVEGWGIERSKIHVIYNGVELSPSLLSREEARKQLGIAGNLVVSVGRMVPWKGFRMLIKIMPQLLQENQFFRLAIVGDGPEMNVLRTMVHNLGLERKVFLVGKKSQEELGVHLAAADMFVLNTGYEGFSHQILEAMTSGTPVITTAVGGNREIIRQGENGFLIKYNDEFNLIEAIKTLWNMPDLRERFATEGKATAQEFSVQRMEQETVKLISTLI